MVHVGVTMFVRSYIVDTPDHKQWWCPDNRHIVDLYFSKTAVYCTVRRPDYTVLQDFKVKKEHKEWEYLVEQFCLLAEKRYPKQIRHKNNEDVVRQRRGW